MIHWSRIWGSLIVGAVLCTMLAWAWSLIPVA